MLQLLLLLAYTNGIGTHQPASRYSTYKHRQRQASYRCSRTKYALSGIDTPTHKQALVCMRTRLYLFVFAARDVGNIASSLLLLARPHLEDFLSHTLERRFHVFVFYGPHLCFLAQSLPRILQRILRPSRLLLPQQHLAQSLPWIRECRTMERCATGTNALYFVFIFY